MGYERTHSFQNKKSYTPQPTTQFSTRPFEASVQMKPKEQQTPEELENEAFNQHKFEAFGLQLKEKSGTITPVEQERLGLLQAKMDDFWGQRLERASRFGFDLSKISVTPPEGQAAPQLQPMGQMETPGVPKEELGSLLTSPQQLSVSPIQAKLTIGQPGDQYEQEADRVASQVVEQINAPEAAPSTQGQLVQRQEGKKEQLQAKQEIAPLQRQKEKLEELQAKSTFKSGEEIAGGEASTDLESSINSARGGGQPLDSGLQKLMGQAMGADFSGVRVHTDTQSDELNQSIQAKAFTTGKDIFFRSGAYEPGSKGGQELLAHELTHVVQQSEGVVQKRTMTKRQRSSLKVGHEEVVKLSQSLHLTQPMMQRKIDKLPGSITNIKGLYQYVYEAIVNGRQQTFEEAILEYIELFEKNLDEEKENKKSGKQAKEKQEFIKDIWRVFQADYNKNLVKDCLISLNKIIKIINDKYKQYPSYPNKAPGQNNGNPEKEYSIPQSQKSIYLATELRDILQLRRCFRFNREKEILGGYMIGVLVANDGKAYATCSGQPHPSFKGVVEELDMTMLDTNVPIHEAKKIIQSDNLLDEEGRIIKKRGQTTEYGGIIGKCAAPKLIWAMLNSLEPKPEGYNPISMTEMYVGVPQELYNKKVDQKELKIANSDNKLELYGDGNVVPSCLTCRKLLKNLFQDFHEYIKEQEKKNAKLKDRQADRVDQERIEQKKQQEIKREELKNLEVKTQETLTAVLGAVQKDKSVPRELVDELKSNLLNLKNDLEIYGVVATSKKKDENEKLQSFLDQIKDAEKTANTLIEKWKQEQVFKAYK